MMAWGSTMLLLTLKKSFLIPDSTLIGEQWLFIDIFFLIFNPKNNYCSLCYIGGHKLEDNALNKSYIKYESLNKGDFELCTSVKYLVVDY